MAHVRIIFLQIHIVTTGQTHLVTHLDVVGNFSLQCLNLFHGIVVLFLQFARYFTKSAKSCR